MRTRSMTVLAAMGVFSCAVIAHSPRHALAAPGPAAPRATPTPAPKAGGGRPEATISSRVVNATVVPTPSRCGEAIQGRVRLDNKTNGPWTGAIDFGGVTTPAGLGASGASAQRSFDLRTGKLDCTKPLGAVPLKVTKTDGAGAALLFNGVLKPTTVSLNEQFSPNDGNGPPPQGKLWLRQITLSGSCGGSVVGSARFEQQGGGGATSVGATGAILRLRLGGATQEVPVGGTGAPAANMMQFAFRGATFDCSAAGGIPAFEYAVIGGGGKVVETNGKLSSYTVTFAP